MASGGLRDVNLAVRVQPAAQEKKECPSGAFCIAVAGSVQRKPSRAQPFQKFPPRRSRGGLRADPRPWSPPTGRKCARHFFREPGKHITKTFTIDVPRSWTPFQVFQFAPPLPFPPGLCAAFCWAALAALCASCFPHAHRFEEGSSRRGSEQASTARSGPRRTLAEGQEDTPRPVPPRGSPGAAPGRSQKHSAASRAQPEPGPSHVGRPLGKA